MGETKLSAYEDYKETDGSKVVILRIKKAGRRSVTVMRRTNTRQLRKGWITQKVHDYIKGLLDARKLELDNIESNHTHLR